MKPSRLWAVARKEFVHIVRDPRSLGMAIAIPMLLLVLFGYALTLDVDDVPTVIWDQSGSQTSREFLSRFSGSPYFSIRGYVQNYKELERAIDSGRALVALVVPRDFAQHIESGRTAEVQMIVDGSDSNTATIAMGYADTIAQGYSQDIAVRDIQRIGGQALRLPLDVRPRVWFNADMESKNYIIPGLIAVIMMVIAALLTSLTVAREWERGTMEQLAATPVTRAEVVLGKLLPYLGVGMVDVAVTTGLGLLLFGVPFRGDAGLFVGLSFLFLAGALGLGVFISAVAKSQMLATQIAMVATFLPAFLISGFMFAIDVMPPPLQAVSAIVPARYFLVVTRGIFLKGIGADVLWSQALFMIAFAATGVGLAIRAFRKELQR